MENAIKADIINFSRRAVKAKSIFYLNEVTKNTAYDFVKSNHYLGDAKFFSELNIGLHHKSGKLLGVATFSRPQGNVALKGWFGLPNSDPSVLELSRLAVVPSLNKTNATSFLLRNSVNKIGKERGIRAVITLADSSRHVGSIYQVCGFKYYGLTDAKSDFWRIDGKKNPRGKTKGVRGVWTPRTRKHRYAVINDPTLECNYEEMPYPKETDLVVSECCDGEGEVEDRRFGDVYTCPICLGELRIKEK